MNESELRDRFFDKGFIAPVSVVSPGDVQRHLRSARELLAEFDRTSGWKSEYLLSQLHHSFRWAYELATADSSLETASRMVGSDLAIWDVALFRKLPEDGPSWWHQDAFPLTINVKHFVSLWLALTPCDPKHGGLAVLPGYHLDGRHQAFVERSAESFLFTGHEKHLPDRPKNTHTIVLQPGEAALLHPWLMHMSYANKANTPRIAVVVRYVRGSVRRLPAFVRRIRDSLPPPYLPVRDLLLMHVERGASLKSEIEAGFQSVSKRANQRLHSHSSR